MEELGPSPRPWTSIKQTLVELEALRNKYRPAHVNILFIGEAPPASGRFFYRADSGLYRAFRTAFIAAFPSLQNAEFLDAFKSLGCYLVDLCENPVDDLPQKSRRLACAAGEAGLARDICDIKPKTVVTVVRSIAANVRHALQLANWSGEYIEVSYPGRWFHHQLAFQEVLVPLLRRELPRP